MPKNVFLLTSVERAQASSATKRHLKARLLFRSRRPKIVNEEYFQGPFKELGLGITPRLHKF